MVPVVIEGNKVPKSGMDRGEKSCVYREWSPYRKPTQVDRKKILRPTGEGLLRNSAS